MNMIKIALTGSAALGLVLAGAANAEPVRAAGSFPGVVSKAARTAAPKAGESAQEERRAGTLNGRTGWFVGTVGAAGAFTAGYFIFEDSGEKVSLGG